MAYVEQYKTKDGKDWYKSVFYAGIDPATGKRVRKSQRGFRTKTDARNAGIKAEAKFMEGKLVETNKTILMKDYLVNWIENYKVDVKEGTMVVHRYNISHYINPHIGYIKLCDYHLRDHQLFINKLYDELGLATTTIRLINGTLHNALKKAISLGMIEKNACNNVEFRKKIVTGEAEFSYFNRKESEIFLEQAKLERQHIYYYLYLMAIHTGMRKGELMALQWSEVDFENKTIKVDKQRLYRQEKKKKDDATKKGEILEPNDTIVFGPPKSDAGFRTLVMSEVVYKALIELRQIQNECKMQYWFNRKYNKLDFVFCFSDFGPIANRTFNGAFDRISERCEGKVPIMTVHDLRHTHAVMLREAGVSLEDIQAILGHGDPASTQIYAHVTNLTKENAMQKFNDHMSEKFS